MSYKELATKDYVNNRVVTIVDKFDSEQANFTPDEILQMYSDKKILLINGFICTLFDMYYNEETNILEEVDLMVSFGNTFKFVYIYDDKTLGIEPGYTFASQDSVNNDISAINKKLSKKYELIKTVTLDSQTNSLTIDADANGNSFKLTDVRLNLILFPLSTPSNIYLTFYNGTVTLPSNVINIKGPDADSTSTPTVNSVHIVNDKGILRVDINDQPMYMNYANLLTSDNQYITKILIKSKQSSIAANSSFEVYGIRY